MFTHDCKYMQATDSKRKYMSEMSTNVMFCTNISGELFTMLVDCQQWRTGIITSANCRGFKDERSWRHMLITHTVLTGTISCRDLASKITVTGTISCRDPTSKINVTGTFLVGILLPRRSLAYLHRWV